VLSSRFFSFVLVTRYTAEENRVKTLGCMDRDRLGVAVVGQAAGDVFEPEGLEVRKFIYEPYST
jgi:hypothetical protein